jgi:hypothetical protein
MYYENITVTGRSASGKAIFVENSEGRGGMLPLSQIKMQDTEGNPLTKEELKIGTVMNVEVADFIEEKFKAVKVHGFLKSKTEKAYWIEIGDKSEWMPKSTVYDMKEIPNVEGYMFTLAKDTAEQKGFEGCVDEE